MGDAHDKDLESDQLTDLVSGEIDRQLRHRGDVIDTMKSQMTKVLKEFEELTWNVQAKRSWMKSVNKAREVYPTTSTAIHPITTLGNIGSNSTSNYANQTSPSKLPKLSGLKARKKLQQQLNRNISGPLPPAEGVPSDARSPDGKITFDRKLPRVAHMEKRLDGMQSLLASQQKQVMHEKALVRYPQCRSNVFFPSMYDDDASSFESSSFSPSSSPFLQPQPAPQTSLELEFVYGVNSGASNAGSSLSQTNAAVGSSSPHASTSSHVFYLSSGELLWFTASLVVLYSKDDNTQRYFREHTHQVTSVAVHPNQHIVASGQVGRETFVLVWDANDDPLGKRFACLKGHSVAVRSISFSHDGKLVASLGGDMYNTICIHDWREQTLLVSARGHSFRVHTIAFNPYQAYGRPETKRDKRAGQALQDDDVCYTLVSCGVRHIRFWTLTKTEYQPPLKAESEQSAFYGSAFGSPVRLRPPTPHDKMWKLEGNVPSFHGRLDVQDFISLTFVDDSPPVYVYDDETKELVVATPTTGDHSLGRVVAGTAKGDLCVFWQPRKSPFTDDDEDNERRKTDPSKTDKEPAKWWEIPDEYTDAEINALVLEKIAYEPTARLVELVPHDVETGNRFKVSKQAHVEIDSIHKRLQLKPNSATLHARLAELKYNGALAHQGCCFQVAYCKKNNLVISSGADGRLVLWKCQLTQPIRVPGVSTHGVFTPLSGTLSEGQHTLTMVDEETKVFKLPTSLPSSSDDETSNSTTGQPQPQPPLSQHPKPVSVAWKDDGKHVVVATSSNCIWELNVHTGVWLLVFEARTGIMAALSCHPTKEEIATASLDGYLSLWDLRRHVCRRRLYFAAGTPQAKATCVEFHPFGDEIVIGMSNGELLVVSYTDLRIIKRKAIKPHLSSNTSSFAMDAIPGGVVPSIAQIKFDTNGDTLAVGCKDTFIYVYDVSNTSSSTYRLLHVCEGHSSAVLHLTWSTDGDVLQSNAADGEVLFWSRNSGAIGSSCSSSNSSSSIMKQVTDAFTVRDTPWAKWSCVFGWATAGIWPPDATNLVDIAALATSGATTRARLALESEESSIETDQLPVAAAEAATPEELVVVANRNTLRLFKWPVARGAKSKTFHAHSSLISALGFTFNDRYVVTVGSDDGTLMQWKCAAPTGTSGGMASPRHKRKQQFKLSSTALATPAEDGDRSDLVVATSPVPPSTGGRSSHGQPSPRQVSRQYRQRGNTTDPYPDTDPDADGHDLPTAEEPAPKLTVIAQCRAKHDFKAENNDELNLAAGELVRVLSKENGEWWLGESCDGTRGVFPSNFVEELESEAPAPPQEEEGHAPGEQAATVAVVEADEERGSGAAHDDSEAVAPDVDPPQQDSLEM